MSGRCAVLGQMEYLIPSEFRKLNSQSRLALASLAVDTNDRSPRQDFYRQERLGNYRGLATT